MKILNKIFGSDQQLTRPDFDSAPTLNFYLSDNIVALRDAPHTAKTPLYENKLTTNIYQTGDMRFDKYGSFSEKIYSRGWEFLGKNKSPIGGCVITAVVQYYEGKKFNDLDCFTKSGLTREATSFSIDYFGGGENGSRESYPTIAEQLSEEVFSDTTWVSAVNLSSSTRIEKFYFTPLSKRHLFVLGCDCTAYNRLDIYSPETNLKDTIETVIHDFMSHVKITYSKRSLEEKNATTSKG